MPKNRITNGLPCFEFICSMRLFVGSCRTCSIVFFRAVEISDASFSFLSSLLMSFGLSSAFILSTTSRATLLSRRASSSS